MSNKVKTFLSAFDEFSLIAPPVEVIDRAKESLLDYLGVTYAGTKALSDFESRFLSSIYEERGHGLAIGCKNNLTLKDAVFLNGLNAHALDFDDGVNAGIIHLASPIMSLLLPLAVKHKTSGSKFLGAVILGYEAAWTIAVSIQPMHKLKGYHATGTCGMLGAVLAATYMLDFDRSERFQAFSIACTSAGGTLKVLEDESQLKPYNVAKACLLALTALQMAKAGFVGPEDAMSGERGFLKLFVGTEDIDLKRPLLDGRYAIMRTYTKPYAACRYCHPSIEAAIDLGEELGRDPAAVRSIRVETYQLAVNKHDHKRIAGTSSAKMSIPYGVAVGYIFGKAGLMEYENDCIRNASVLELAQKVTVESDETMTKDFPRKTTARVQFTLHDGSTLEKVVDHPRGEPGNPMSYEGICSKFREMMAFAERDPHFANSIIRLVSTVEKDLASLLDLIAKDSK